MPDLDTDNDVTGQTSTIVAAYLTRNPVSTAEIPNLITTVHAALAGLGQMQTLPAEPLRPAVSVRKSITPEFLICLEDGKKLKMLKRHLRSTYDMTPDQYRAKWNLPPDYPMTAPRYSESRSTLAKKLGLGRGNTRTAAPPAATRRGGNAKRKAGKSGNAEARA